ncbi:MAG: PfkB family carbohydrate kinase [Armatimonadota bacterium]
MVAGGALVDVRASTGAGWMPGQSLPGKVRLLPGGAARNVAVNVTRLGHAAVLLSAVGLDPLGRWLLQSTSEAGVDVTHVLSRHGSTGVFVTVAAPGGETWSVADAGLSESLDAVDLESWRPVIADASLVVTDANLLEPVQRALASQAAGIPRVLLATSPQKSVRLRPVLSGAAALVCNRPEALVLTGLPATLGWQALGTALLTEGVERVVLTLGPAGVAVLTADEAVKVPAADVPVVEPAGAGDAVAAAAVHACLAGLDPQATADLAVAAAAEVVRSEENTPAGLSTVIHG